MTREEILKEHSIKIKILLEQGVEFDRIGYTTNLVEENSLLEAMSTYAELEVKKAIKEKDEEISMLRSLKSVSEKVMESSANTIEDMQQELKLQSETIKELREALDEICYLCKNSLPSIAEDIKDEIYLKAKQALSK